MHRFVIDPAEPSVIQGEEHRHLTRVLRLRQGDRVELLDGERILLAQIQQMDKERTLVRVLEELPSREAALAVTLYIGCLKGEKMDWVAQKAQELGALALIPVAMKRSVAQGAKTERLLRIAREAQKQCGRARCMAVGDVISFDQALEAIAGHREAVVPYEEGGESITNLRFNGDLGLLIGPEGGIEPEEIEKLRGIGARVATLGPRILRAETAAVASLAALMALAGEWA